jgi:hypothetical protein
MKDCMCEMWSTTFLVKESHALLHGVVLYLAVQSVSRICNVDVKAWSQSYGTVQMTDF